MVKSSHSTLGSFVLSLISPRRDGRRASKHVPKDSPPIQIFRDPLPSMGTVDIQTATTEALDERAPTPSNLGHRRSQVFVPSAEETMPEEEVTLTQFSNILRVAIDDLSPRNNRSTSKHKQMASMPPIEEEPEARQIELDSRTFNSSLTCCSLEGEFPSSGSQTTNPSVYCSFQASESNISSGLQSEVNSLKLQFATANQEIQNLNAELSEARDSELLMQETEERLENLLIEKSEWGKASKMLSQNLCTIAADLQNSKHCNVLLRHDNAKLKTMIQSYKDSVEALHPRPTLRYEDDIERQSAELIWPISALELSREQTRIFQVDRVLPHGTNRDAVLRFCTTSAAVISPHASQYAQNIPTPARTPSLTRSMKSLKLRSSSSLKRLASTSGISGSVEDSPFKQKNHQPFERSPLNKVIIPENLSSECLLFCPPAKAPTPEALVKDADEDEPSEFYDCEEGSEESDGTSGRTSRLGIFPGSFQDDFFL